MVKIKWLILSLIWLWPQSLALAKTELPKFVHLKVPFLAQAPFGTWSDARQQDACEEASLIMAKSWLKGEVPSKDSALKQILALSKWQDKNLGYYQDTSATSTAWMFKKYFNQKAEVKLPQSFLEIKQELANGNLVIVPANGKLLKNKYFTRGGPDRHMVVVIGYDDKVGDFITNDVGTRWGRDYHYKYEVLWSAIRDYPSGKHSPIVGVNKNILIISKK